MVLRERRQNLDGSNLFFDPVRVGVVWTIDSVTFEIGGFPFATFAYVMSLQRGTDIVYSLRNENAPNSTLPQSYSISLPSTAVFFPGEQPVLSYGAGASALGFAGELRGQIVAERDYTT